MGLLERSKVRLSCKVDAEVYSPGDTISGEVHLDVKARTTFSALRLHVLGREVAEVFVQRGTATLVATTEADYLNSWLTFTGPVKRSHSRETQVYEPGCYCFPFTLNLATQLPPSFAVTSSSGSVKLGYSATAVLDIPNGFDASDACEFVVRSCVPHQQHENFLRGGASQRRTVRTFRSDFFGCLCGERKDAPIDVTMTIEPGIVCLTDATPHCTARLHINNASREVLRDIKVELYNAARIHYDTHESFSTPLVAQATLRDCGLMPGACKTVEVPLEIIPDRFRTNYTQSSRLPVPTLTTPMVTSAYVFRVKFPRNRTENLACYGLFDLVETTSSSRGLRSVPARFHHLHAPPVDMRYVLQPTAISIPPGESVFPTEHSFYLPRTENSPLAAEAEEEVEEETAPPVAAPEPVMATVVPGRIVRGVILEDNQGAPCVR